ncbi:MAG TPA: hypothetical protein VN368_00910 [Candidatus Methylomirabilis sp.]|nr:hypothetical protein [Candidatus Methylomirabilis sp.]
MAPGEKSDLMPARKESKRMNDMHSQDEDEDQEIIERKECTAKFKSLLKDMFCSESADLDFGIYRIMNYKRKQTEKFIDDLIEEISGLDKVLNADKKQ